MRPDRDERGVALVLALLALVMLSGLLLVLLTIGGMEPSLAANLNEIVRARYLADAGVEWAFDLLAENLDWSGQLRGPDNVAGTADDGRLASGIALPGLPATSGTFTATIRNDNQPGDNLLTGLAVDPGGATTDTNGVVIITTTGTYNGVSRQIQVVMTGPPPIPGGVNLPGVGTNTAFDGNSFTITGNDTNLNDTGGTCAPNWGIGVADTATEGLVQASLTSQQKDNVTGKPQDPALDGGGDNTIAPAATLTPAMISRYLNALKGKANLSLQSTGGSPLVYASIGSTCSTDWNSANCWGTGSRPKIVYVKGDVDPTNAFTALTISENSTGAGVLIIEDGDLALSGNFQWEGLIIITGKYVGLRYAGGGHQSVYGGIVVNQTEAVNLNVEADVRGNAEVFYSCQALSNIRKMRGLFTLTSWREL